MEYSIFLHPDGYGYRISSQETSQFIEQLYDPTLPGFVSMSEEVAEARALAVIEGLNEFVCT